MSSFESSRSNFTAMFYGTRHPDDTSLDSFSENWRHGTWGNEKWIDLSNPIPFAGAPVRKAEISGNKFAAKNTQKSDSFIAAMDFSPKFDFSEPEGWHCKEHSAIENQQIFSNLHNSRKFLAQAKNTKSRVRKIAIGILCFAGILPYFLRYIYNNNFYNLNNKYLL